MNEHSVNREMEGFSSIQKQFGGFVKSHFIKSLCSSKIREGTSVENEQNVRNSTFIGAESKTSAEQEKTPLENGV
jgi:hypothetical protein